MTDELGAAALAAAVIDEEEAREEAQARVARADHLPGRPAPRRQLGARQLQGSLRARRRDDVRRPRAAARVRRARGRRDPGASSPRSRTTFGISKGTVVFIGTASAAFFVLGAVPMGWLADRVKRVPIVGIALVVLRVLHLPVGPRAQRVHALLDAVRGRHRQGEQHPGPPVAARRQLPDRHPRPDVGGHEHGRARHRHHQPDPRRRDRDVGRWPRGLALGLVHPRHPGRDRRGRSRSS